MPVNRIALPLMPDRAPPSMAIHFDLIEIARLDETAPAHRQLVIVIIQVHDFQSPCFRIHKLTALLALQATDVDLEPHRIEEIEHLLETR